MYETRMTVRVNYGIQSVYKK